jgi:glycosyltransferase involved in cell wall biosynthesis
MYKYYGVQDEKLTRFAFSWGYDSMLKLSDEYASRRRQLRSELAIPENSYVILYCGRLSPEKGLPNLIEAYENLERPNKVLAIAGDGPLKESLYNYTVEHNINSVHFFGFQGREEIAKYYAISDVLVLPSHRETWGMVISESMCFGLPIISSVQVGASMDLVRDGYNGFTYSAGDVEALTEILQKMVDLPEEDRATMGKNSRQLIEQWSNRNLVDTLNDYLSQILSGRHTQ